MSVFIRQDKQLLIDYKKIILKEKHGIPFNNTFASTNITYSLLS